MPPTKHNCQPGIIIKLAGEGKYDLNENLNIITALEQVVLVGTYVQRFKYKQQQQQHQPGTETLSTAAQKWTETRQMNGNFYCLPIVLILLFIFCPLFCRGGKKEATDRNTQSRPAKPPTTDQPDWTEQCQLWKYIIVGAESVECVF